MPHTVAEKKKVLTRVRRIKGQLEALEQALERGEDCSPILQQITSIRGAMNGLMAGVLESHLREELMNSNTTVEARESSIEDAVTLIRTYLR
ncbi:formaldehyde-responsive transcriptional repressor FrmR [Rahnella sp. RcJ3]|jgi:DNA-binding FrmR family transcriptional regulator|uniref:formaldehyde-responsive transcriptional repressor FrmR n=1 Tax=Rahnella sp. RcJ3 TaxID=2292446 RepID=UPI001297C613|nr:formaldehyde-responsive transcriptional repressor FrmR [Rahnella sp. RcJ3]MQB56073.1 DNA-binding transcriptional repressor FrmR [Rahnella sp. RcJ3]